jgi:hypothetical protein
MNMNVAGFTNGEEEELQRTPLVPFLVEGGLHAQKAG